MKKVIFSAALVLSLTALAACSDKEETAEGTVDAPQSENSTTDEPAKDDEQAALEKAKSYVEAMSLSKQGVYDQLTSPNGDKFSKEAAEYAITNLKADYNAAALRKAKIYSDSLALSKEEIYEQLMNEHGDKFTEEEAKYAIDNL